LNALSSSEDDTNIHRSLEVKEEQRDSFKMKDFAPDLPDDKISFVLYVMNKYNHIFEKSNNE
jgi:hypothetical protein